MKRKAIAKSSVPVLCVGNFTLGGAGKTPTVIALVKAAKKLNLSPGILSRGFGGSSKRPTLVDFDKHQPQEVGDEPLMLAIHAPTVVSADRPAGAALLQEQGVDLIIMDDGFQNSALHKDHNLVVVDGRRGIGNGMCFPAGPLRAKFATQLALANSVLLIGPQETGTDLARLCARAAKPLFRAELELRNRQDWQEINVLAYCGIADPAKFHASLRQAGANIVKSQSFTDHHQFSNEDCRNLLDDARDANLVLATTEKDAARLTRAGSVHKELLTSSRVLYVDLVFDNPRMIQQIIQNAIKQSHSERLQRKTVKT